MGKYDRIYCSVMNYDSFVGFSVPLEMQPIIDFILEKTGTDFIDQVFDDYEEYRDYEVECASQARHGSNGTEKINTPAQLRKEYSGYINRNKELKEYFDKICPEKKEEPVKHYSGGGITGCTY